MLNAWATLANIHVSLISHYILGNKTGELMREKNWKEQAVRQHQRGFTLIELLIVLVILSIIGLLAIGLLPDTTAKAQLSEVTGLEGSYKTRIGIAYTENGSLTGVSSGSFGLPAANVEAGRYVKNISVTDGVVTYTLKALGTVDDANTAKDIAATIAGQSVVYTPRVSGGSLLWACTVSAGIPDAAIPKGCSK